MQGFEFAPPILFLAAIVWGIVQVLKVLLPDVNPQPVALVVAVIVGAVAYFTGYLPDAPTNHPIHQVGMLILCVLTAYGLHNYVFKPGLGSGSSHNSGGGAS